MTEDSPFLTESTKATTELKGNSLEKDGLSFIDFTEMLKKKTIYQHSRFCIGTWYESFESHIYILISIKSSNQITSALVQTYKHFQRERNGGKLLSKRKYRYIQTMH